MARLLSKIVGEFLKPWRKNSPAILFLNSGTGVFPFKSEQILGIRAYRISKKKKKSIFKVQNCEQTKISGQSGEQGIRIGHPQMDVFYNLINCP